MQIENLKYYTVTNKKLYYYFNDSGSSINFYSLNDFFETWLNFEDTYYKQLITIPANDSLVYVINVGNLSAIEYDGESEIIFTFKNNDTLNLHCLTSTDTLYNYQYAKDVFNGFNIEQSIKTRNKLYVSLNNTEDIGAGIFNNINTAANYAAEGDIIIIESGNYTVSEIALKNGVDYLIKGATITNNSGNVFKDSLGGVFCRIYGTGNFITSDIALKLDSSSNVYFEFDSIQSGVAGVYCHSILDFVGVTLRCKGNSIVSDLHCLDSDGYVNCYDADVRYINAGGQGYYPSDSRLSNVYIRNSFMTSSNIYATIYLDHSSGDGYNFNGVNLRIKNLSPLSSCIDFPIFASPSVNLFNCYLQSIGQYGITALDPQVITYYGVNYQNKVNAGNVTTAGSGSVVIDTSLSLTR